MTMNTLNKYYLLAVNRKYFIRRSPRVRLESRDMYARLRERATDAAEISIVRTNSLLQ